MKKTLPRDVQQRIVADLSRGHRTVQAIAERHHVPVQVVRSLCDHYGPDMPSLIAAAAMLRKPGPAVPTTHDGVVLPPVDVPPVVAKPTPKPEPEPTPEPVEDLPAPVVVITEPPADPDIIRQLVDDVTPPTRRGGVYVDGLGRDDRNACRAWWASIDAKANARGMIPRRVVAGWETAGRPTVAPPQIKTMQNNGTGALPVVEVVPDIPHAVDATWTPTEPAPELEPAADAPTPADDLVDAETVDVETPHEEACHDLHRWLVAAEQLRDTIRQHPDLVDAVQDAGYFLARLVDAAGERQEADRLVEQATDALYELAMQGLLKNTRDHLRDAARAVLAAVKVA